MSSPSPKKPADTADAAASDPAAAPATTGMGQDDNDDVILAQAPIEADSAEASTLGGDSNTSDLESIYESEAGSMTDTLASYVTRYQYLSGRAFDPRGTYIVSLDETQREQFDIFHEIYYRLLGKRLYIAPITENPHRVLDLGAGTGLWAIDFADMHPSAEVVGIDIVPIQPAWVPPNCHFQIDDFNMDFTFTKESFDFVHIRAIHGGVKDWSHMVRECFKVLKPGGWLEVVGEDVSLYCDDGTLPPDTPIQVWMKDIVEAMEKTGQTLEPYRRLKEPMEDAGFDISTYKHEVYPCPIGTWAKNKEIKELGALMLVNMLQGMEGWSMFIYTQLIGKSVEEVHELIQSWHKDLRVKKHHKYMRINAVYAQKPYR